MTRLSLAVSLIKCKEKRQFWYDEHIPRKTQKCKGIHWTDQAEIIEIDSLYPADLQMCWELILVSLILRWRGAVWIFYLCMHAF